MSRKPLTPDQWKRVKELFNDALPLAPAQRAAYLANQDARLRDEVLALLSEHEEADGSLEGAERVLFEAGRRLGPYEIRVHLGGGGMGEVYRAHDNRLHRDVAVKVLRDRLVDSAARARFDREAHAIAALSHANVLAIHDVGDDSGLPYLVTELLEGETLRARLGRGPPPVAQALEWASQIALGLAAAHDEGIVHRDLKPENVFLLADGWGLKILDFGLARPVPGSRRAGHNDDSPTLPGMIVGTAGYLAPEQARGEPPAATADLFAMGAILFELLTGTRAFRGQTVVDTIRAIVDHDPPPPSSLRAEVPHWLDRVVARCLAKDARARFQSARDLAFTLSTPPEVYVETSAPPRPRRLPVALGVAAIAATTAIAALLWPREGAPPAREPAQPRPLTFSGRDSEPAVSPDGRFLAFASDRDGASRIWLQQLDVGRETALTAGPDSAPRFSPDGGQVLFTRAHGAATALHRVALVGGEVRRVADDAADGDWSPDGRHVVFVRWPHGTEGRAALMMADIEGAGLRELARIESRSELRPRWSPDGKLVAVTGQLQQPGATQTVVLVPVDASEPRALPAPNGVGLVSGVAWDGPGALLYSQARSVAGNWAGGGARIVRQRLDDGAAETLLWTLESSLVLDRWPRRGVVFETRSTRQNLREVTLSPGADALLSNGTATDRQPVFSRDGESVVFSSNRGANLDVWMVSRRSGATRRLTDHPADDWDPAVTPDGRHLLWGSNRSGAFEVWMAEADGTRPRQVTRDGDAENPTATPDGEWVVYASGAPGRAGVWRIRPDGTDALRLVPDVVLPQVSPDGNYVLFQSNRDPRLVVVGVASVADGRLLPFEIRIETQKQPLSILGRARWMPDGRRIAFLGQDERGRTGVFVQRFAIGEDTTASREPIAGFAAERIIETFDVAPGGDRLILAEWEQRSAVVAATLVDAR